MSDIELTATVSSTNVSGTVGCSSLVGSVGVNTICGVVNPTISGVGIYVPYVGCLKDIDLGSYSLETTGDLTCDTLHYTTLDPPVSVTGYVPYTGATGDVNLGVHDLIATRLDLGSGGDFANLEQLRIHDDSALAKLRITTGFTGTGANRGLEVGVFDTAGYIDLYELGDLDIYTNNVLRASFYAAGGLNVVGNITGGNLSGTNTGDQDLSGYVPYTGATNNLDLGTYNLDADDIKADGNVQVDEYVKASGLIANGTNYSGGLINGQANVVAYVYNSNTGRLFSYDGSNYYDLAIGDWNAGHPNIMLKVGGDVGINEGSPSYKLDVAGTIRSQENLRVVDDAILYSELAIGTDNSPTEMIDAFGSAPIFKITNESVYSTTPIFTMQTDFQYNAGGSYANYPFLLVGKSNDTDGNTKGKLILRGKESGVVAVDVLTIDGIDVTLLNNLNVGNDLTVTGNIDVTGVITDYVPYTGATTNINLGSNNLQTTGTLTALNINSSNATLSGELIVDTNTLVVNKSSYENKVGINTLTPRNALEVVGTVQADGLVATSSSNFTAPTGSYMRAYYYESADIGRLYAINGSTYKGMAFGTWNSGTPPLMLTTDAHLGVNRPYASVPNSLTVGGYGSIDDGLSIGTTSTDDRLYIFASGYTDTTNSILVKDSENRQTLLLRDDGYLELSRSDLNILVGDLDVTAGDINLIAGDLNITAGDIQLNTVNISENIGNLDLFSDTVEGETPYLKIYGYRTGDIQRSLGISTGLSEDDCVDFKGLSKYNFDGNIQASNFLLDASSNLIIGDVEDYSISASSSYNILLNCDDGGSSLTSGDHNILIGEGAGVDVTNGSDNTFIGYNAGANVTTSSNNVAIGPYALFHNRAASNNIAIGGRALYGNFANYFTGNVAVGYYALNDLTTGDDYNVGVGYYSGRNCQGDSNIHIGYNSGYNSSTDYDSSYDIKIGYQTGDNATGGNNNILIGKNIDKASAGSSNTLNIANILFGTSLEGEGTTIKGILGIGVSDPDSLLEINNVNGGTTILSVKGSHDAEIFVIDEDKEIRVNGTTKLGDGGTTSYAEFKADGELELYKNARVVKYEWMPANAVQAPGAQPATLTKGTQGCYYSFADNQEKDVCFNMMVPEDADLSEAMYICIGWSSPARRRDCVWEIDYLITAPDDDTTAAGSNTSVTKTSSYTANGLVNSTIATITGGTVSSSDICIHCTLMRDGDNASDTLGDIAALHGITLKYTSNKLGEST